MKRPVSPLVLGSLNLLFGALGTLAVAVSLFVMVSGLDLDLEEDALDAALSQSALYAFWDGVSSALGAIFSLLLIFSGIGMVLYREWGRRLALVYAVYAAFDIPVTLLVFSVTVPQAIESVEMFEVVMTSTVLAVGYGLAALYIVALTFFMTRPRVKAAFVAPHLFDREHFGESPFARQEEVTVSVASSNNPFAPPPV